MDERQVYEQRLQRKLHEWGAEIDKLKARATKAAAGGRLDYHGQIEKLQSMREDSERKLAELREAGDDAWGELQAGVKSATNSLENSLKWARSKLR